MFSAYIMRSKFGRKNIKLQISPNSLIPAMLLDSPHQNVSTLTLSIKRVHKKWFIFNVIDDYTKFKKF